MNAPPLADLEWVAFQSLTARKLRVSALQHRFLCEYSGDNLLKKQNEGLFVLEHIGRLIDRDARESTRSVIHQDYQAQRTLSERILGILCDVATIIRTKPRISSNRILQQLQDNKAYKDISGQHDAEQLAKQTIFNVIGCQGATCFTNAKADLKITQRPMDELLRSFGEVLPKRRIDRHRTELGPLKFQVSSLNAATLKQLARIEIVWVDTIGAHLDFDPTVPALCLFRTPSFCKLHETPGSLLNCIARDFYVEHEAPVDGFTTTNLLKEIILSYGLFFRDTRHSRKLYKESERAKSIMPEFEDMDQLCGYDLRTSFTFNVPVRETSDAQTDFPILRRRLRIVQDYMDGIEPSRVASLWNDRRDLRLWYTIWAVIILGGVSIVQASIAIFLSAAQVAIAQRR